MNLSVLQKATRADLNMDPFPYVVIDNAGQDVAWMALYPETGRTHQIRVHLDYLGHPILGDKIYGQPDSTFIGYLQHGVSEKLCHLTQFPRHALHAQYIEFPTINSVRCSVKAPLPSDMQAIVDGEKPAWKFNPGSAPV